MQKEICHAARTSKYQMENHRNRGKKLRDKIVEQEEKCVVFYTDISCLGGVFAKNTSRETKNFASRKARDI
jgi:hypothetical protein